MKPPTRFGPPWSATLIVLVVVLGAGGRLIYLGAQRHALLAHQAAQRAGGAVAARIATRLQALRDAAARLAADPALAAGAGAAPADPHTFRMDGDGAVLEAGADAAPVAEGIAAEWHSVGSGLAGPPREAAGAQLLGPVRLGSQWLLAVRLPAGGAPARAWAVAYTDLDQLLAPSGLSGLGAAGYDFELSQTEPHGTRSRIFASSAPTPLRDALDVPIALPAATVADGGGLEVALRPRDGWYSTPQLAAECTLLVFLAWLLAFGTHDLLHALERSQSLLHGARRRMHKQNRQLAEEIRQRLELVKSVERVSFHDPFTGLPNRRHFMERLDRALREVRSKSRQAIGVMLIDVVRFKLVNDTLGHTAGDELMGQVARRFEAVTAAAEGVLARWGVDQLALLLPEAASAQGAQQLAGVLQGQLREPFALRRHRLVVSARIGITWTDSGQQRAEDVVRQAAIALSAANRSEAARSVLYAPDMAGQAANLVSLEADLHVALEKHELHVLFQPIVDLQTRTMVGAETLLRWRHPVEGVIAPDGFLRIAEEAGLMVPITRWVILRALRTAADWRRRLPREQTFFVSVNLSPTALRDRSLGDFVATLLRETQMAPSFLKFEVTEASLISNVAAARETLERLHGMGVQLMLDDFGTGYSSLSYLQTFPFDFVKIDRPFIETEGADRANTGVVAAMVQIAASLKLASIAEVIETEEAAAVLQEMGCQYGQGYFFSAPVDAEVALQRLRSRDPFRVPPPTSATQKLRPLAEDESATVVMPVGSIRFPPDGPD